MSFLSRMVVLTAAVVVAAPVAALSELTPEERAENRRRVDKWRADPDHFARLRADARAYFDMTPERQGQILKLDHDLAVLPATTQTHLLEVAKRYTDWLDQLPEAQQQRIKEAPASRARLDRIRELREQEWIRRLPRAQRDQVEKAKEGQRGELIRQYRLDERKRRREWQIAFRHWEDLIKKRPLPATLADFPPDVQTYVNEYLRPLLNGKEKARLVKADGKWPAYPYTLVALADKHPMALPGPTGPTHFKGLPAEVQNRLSAALTGFKKGTRGFAKKAEAAKTAAKKVEAALKKFEGSWPEYARAVTGFARKYEISLPYELWPSRREDLSLPVRHFVDKTLMPALDENEKAQLKDAEWKWPLYPRTLQELAQKHTLQVPWQTLPDLHDGQREKWDNYRLRPVRPADALANPLSLKRSAS